MRMKLQQKELTIDDYLLDCKMRGLSEKTISTYHQHLERCYGISDNVQEIVLELNKLSPNTRNSYLRSLKAYLNWKGEKIPFKLTKYESSKTAYTDDELKLLLKKPTTNDFCETRNWLIIMLMIDTGIRSSTLRQLKTTSIDFTQNLLIINNEKTHSVQAVPFSKTTALHLKSFINNKENTEYLFCNEFGGQLSANGLKLAIRKYNRKRGVNKTSVHCFRHTFAKKYLLQCGGNAFSLQKMLGHSTLNITKEYCKLYDKDIIDNYISPVETITNRKVIFK